MVSVSGISLFLLFKQKTAYEMRISDWSSDVCSSDLINVSVIVAPLIAGTLGEKVSWHWGFGTAGIVMVLGLVLYIMAGPWLPKDNRPSKAAGATKPSEPLSRQDWLRIAAVVILVPVLAISLLTNQEIFNASLVWADPPLDR